MSAPQANAKSGLEVLPELEEWNSTAVVEFVEHRRSLFSLRVARNAFAVPSRSGRFRRPCLHSPDQQRRFEFGNRNNKQVEDAA